MAYSMQDGELDLNEILESQETTSDFEDDTIYTYGDDWAPRTNTVSSFVLNFHEAFAPLYVSSHPAYKARYMIFYGGRAGRKSWEIARGLILRATQSKLRIVCAREYQNSIEDSVKALLTDQIAIMGLEEEFDIQKTKIVHKETLSQFIFKGLAKSTVQSIKSLEGADICWAEEAQVISEESWRVLTPTIRKPGSQIIISLNPELIDDPTSKRFIVNPPPGAYKRMVNYTDNKDCPVELIKEAEWCKFVDYDAYLHIWMGEFRKASDAQIFKGKWRVAHFTPQPDDRRNKISYGWDGPYYGMDFGFSVDPLALVEIWFHDKRLYVYREFCQVGVEIEEMPPHMNKVLIPNRRALVRADRARPELISWLNGGDRQYNIYPCEKWDGCVEDGIAWMRNNLEIIISPDCKHTQFEMKYYSYKVDKKTGEVLPVIVDKHNHCIDAIRYGCEDQIKQRLQKYSSWV